jgi:Dolichyl-phosphate-mannose-protein mannosyltransferase
VKSADRPLPSLDVERFAAGPVLLIAAALFALDMALAGRYGFHGDELYFLDAARHLQGGYVDQPILVPLLARELGGRRNAQLLAALATATMPAVIGTGDLLEPTTLDILFWAALALVVVRVGRTGDCRYWLLGGVVLGVGLANKHSIGFFAVAIFLGALLSGGWRLVLNRWALAGAVIAAFFTIPDVWWQATNGWPTIAMTQALNQENGGLGNISTWVVGQLLMVTLALAWLWVVGIVFLWRSGSPLWRALVWAYVLLFVLFALTTGAKIYYLAAAYVYLLAAGAVQVEAWLSTHRVRSGLVLAATALTTALILPVVLPILPASALSGSQATSPLGEEVGWPDMVDTVATVWFSLPGAQRANAVILTFDYSQAGAINELGPGLGLPTAVSAHNTEWFWGPGNPNATTVVAWYPGSVDLTSDEAVADLSQYFQHVRVAATISNSAGVHNQDWGGHVYVCTGLKHPWATLWPMLRHYS